jgi:DNA-3-methyladenine glycosylase
MGIEIMEKNRHFPGKIQNLTNGPGKLTQAFGITKTYNHHNLLKSSQIFLSENIFSSGEKQVIGTSARVGISKGRQHLWRFFLKNNPFVSSFKGYIS